MSNKELKEALKAIEIEKEKCFKDLFSLGEVPFAQFDEVIGKNLQRIKGFEDKIIEILTPFLADLIDENQSEIDKAVDLYKQKYVMNLFHERILNNE